MYNQTHLDAYAVALTKNFSDWKYTSRQCFNKEDYVVSFDKCVKYIRVVRFSPTDCCVVAFIEITSGDIYKPVSWKSPIRNKVRGNVEKLTPNVVCWSGAR